MRQVQAMLATSYFHKRPFRFLFLAVLVAFLFLSLLFAVTFFVYKQNAQLNDWLELAVGKTTNAGFFNSIIDKLLTIGGLTLLLLLVGGLFLIWRFTYRVKDLFLTNFLMGLSKGRILFHLLMQVLTVILGAAFVGMVFLLVIQTPFEQVIRHFLPVFSHNLTTTASSSISYSVNLSNFMDLNFSYTSWLEVTFSALFVTIAMFMALLFSLTTILWWNAFRQLKRGGGELRLD
jgi:hypothetical protein